MLTYGYCDVDAGLTLEVLAAAVVDGDNASFGDGNANTRAIVRIGMVAEDEFFYLEDEDGSLAKRHADKLERLHAYDADEKLERTREISLIDDCRHEENIDDVMVYLVKDGVEPEVCWARLLGIKDKLFHGILLNEPYQNFGCHKDDEIAFSIAEFDDEVFRFVWEE